MEKMGDGAGWRGVKRCGTAQGKVTARRHGAKKKRQYGARKKSADGAGWHRKKRYAAQRWRNIERVDAGILRYTARRKCKKWERRRRDRKKCDAVAIKSRGNVA
ncbi:MAG: hypothetical protein LBM59_04225 [Ruminococcus sp.]|nr:hypothetical protein [Ruminococcus sp.]